MIEYVLKIGSLEFLATSAADAAQVMDALSKMKIIQRMCNSGYSEHIYYAMPNSTGEIKIESLDAPLLCNLEAALIWKANSDEEASAKKAKETQP